MQIVILAAGRGTRMRELTDTLPKPLLTVAEKSLLDHKLELLPAEISEILIVIGYKGEAIREALGTLYKGVPVRYVEQPELNGSAGALFLCRQFLHGQFLVMNGDDLYAKETLATLAHTSGWAMAVQEITSFTSGGSIIVDADGFVRGISSAVDSYGRGGYANTGLYVLDERIFGQPRIALPGNNLEFGLPHTILAAANALTIPLKALKSTGWKSMTTPEDIKNALV